MVDGYIPDLEAVDGNMSTEGATITVTYIPAIVDSVTVNGGIYSLNHEEETAVFLKAADPDATEVRINSSVEANGKKYTVKTVVEKACKGMKVLTEVTIGSKVETIGKSAFANCQKLRTVDGGKGIVRLGEEAFESCEELTEMPNLNRVQKIADQAFRKTGLKKVILAESVTAVGNSAFALCPSLKTVEGGENLTEIGEHAFDSCVKLTRVPVWLNLQIIGKSAFQDCSALEEITFEVNMKEIGMNAFQGCVSLEFITFMSRTMYKTKNIGVNAFENTHPKPTVKCPLGTIKKYRPVLLKRGLSDRAVFK